MGKYTYEGNLDPHDGTTEISHQDERPNLVLGGAAGELSDEEVARLSARHTLLPEGAERVQPESSEESAVETPDEDEQGGEAPRTRSRPASG